MDLLIIIILLVKLPSLSSSFITNVRDSSSNSTTNSNSTLSSLLLRVRTKFEVKIESDFQNFTQSNSSGDKLLERSSSLEKRAFSYHLAPLGTNIHQSFILADKAHHICLIRANVIHFL